jgi:hypothetical protein
MGTHQVDWPQQKHKHTEPMKTQSTEAQSNNNCYSNCDKNAKPVCARSAAFASNNTRERRVEAGSRYFQTSSGRVSLIPSGFLFHNGSTISGSLFSSSFLDGRMGRVSNFLARRFSHIRFSWFWEQSGIPSRFLWTTYTPKNIRIAFLN